MSCTHPPCLPPVKITLYIDKDGQATFDAEFEDDTRVDDPFGMKRTVHFEGQLKSKADKRVAGEPLQIAA